MCGARPWEPEDDSPLGKPSGFDYGSLAPWIPLAASLLIVLFVVPLDSAQYPGTRLLKIVLITVISTAMLALLAAARVEGKDWKMPATAFTGFSPAVWFGLMLPGWLVLFPVFFYVHYLHHNRTRIKFAWAASALFLITVVWAWPRDRFPEADMPLPPLVLSVQEKQAATVEPEVVAETLPPLPTYDGAVNPEVSPLTAFAPLPAVEASTPTVQALVPDAPAAPAADGTARVGRSSAGSSENSYGLSVPKRKGKDIQ